MRPVKPTPSHQGFHSTFACLAESKKPIPPEGLFWQCHSREFNLRDTLQQTTDLTTGIVVEEQYLRGNRKHRDPVKGPALVRRDPETGVVTLEAYYVDGKLHREDGPAEKHLSKSVRSENYYRHGVKHRDPEEGPAVTTISLSLGTPVWQCYYWNGKLHRHGGPALIEHNRNNGKLSRQYYCLDGEYVSRNEALTRHSAKPGPQLG